MPDARRNLPNFYITENGISENYTSPKQGGGRKPLPFRNRREHAEALRFAFEQVIEDYRKQKLSKEPELAEGEPGFYLEFKIQKNELEALEKLENRTKKIELLAVRVSDETISATVFVPETASDVFPSKIEDYRNKETDKGNPKNEALIARLEDINLGTIRSLFTDNLALFPTENQFIWWEIWLRKGRIDAFRQIAQILDIRIALDELHLGTSQFLFFQER